METTGFVDRVAEAVLRRTRERQLLDYIAAAVSARLRQTGAKTAPSDDDFRQYVLQHFGHLADAGPTPTEEGAT